MRIQNPATRIVEKQSNMSAMSSTLATSFHPVKSPPLSSPSRLPTGDNSRSPASVRIGVPTVPRATSPSSNSSSSSDDRGSYINRGVTQSLKTLAKAAILIGAAASIATKPFPARAEAATPVAVSETLPKEREGTLLDGYLEPEEGAEIARHILKDMVLKGKDNDALSLAEAMMEAQPSANEWKLFKARLLWLMGRLEDAGKVFEEMLVRDPLLFEASFEHALVMDHCGKAEGAIGRLQEALYVAIEEDPAREARDTRLIIAHLQLLGKNVEVAIASYQKLTNEDPGDFRPYFCLGHIYMLLGQFEDAQEPMANYFELSQKKLGIDWLLLPRYVQYQSELNKKKC